MRSLRLLAFIMLFALFAATPHIGAWVATASASTGPMTSGQEAVNAPANDNDDELCNSGNPRKQKKCHYNQTNGDNDNDASNDAPPAVSIGVSNNDPEEDDTITVTLHATGHEIDQVWWWVPDVFTDNGNDNEEFEDIARVFNCDGVDDCTQSSDVTPRNAGTFTIYAKARDRQGRESAEVATDVRVHDD